MLEFVQKLMHRESGVDIMLQEFEQVEEAQKLRHYLNVEGNNLLKTSCSILHYALTYGNSSIKQVVSRFVCEIAYSSGQQFLSGLTEKMHQFLFKV